MVLCHGMQGIYILFKHKQMFLRPGCQETFNQGVQICCHKSEINALLWRLQGHTLSHLFCCLIPVRERMDVCLELLLDRFSVCPAANAAFSVVVWKVLLMFQTFSMCIQGFSSLTYTWKWFWADFALCWVSISILLNSKFILIIS